MKSYKYNDLTITQDELECAAEEYAEMYYYDTKCGGRPQSAMRMFYEEFGECDSFDEYEYLFFEYLTLCEKFKNDPEIIAKYQDDEE